MGLSLSHNLDREFNKLTRVDQICCLNIFLKNDLNYFFNQTIFLMII